jgi:hypothetical protein
MVPINVTDLPTSSPVVAVVETPTIAPSNTFIPTLFPTDGNVSSMSPTTIIDEESSVVPSDVPTSEPDASLCMSNSACTVLDLKGECCPTADGTTLLCCGTGVVEETCALNNICVDYELTAGTCCPTNHTDIPEIDNKYLDCCAILPDECKIDINRTEAENSKCEFMSTVDYKVLLEQNKRSSRSGAVTRTTTATTTLASFAAGIITIVVMFNVVI